MEGPNAGHGNEAVEQSREECDPESVVKGKKQPVKREAVQPNEKGRSGLLYEVRFYSCCHSIHS